VEYGLSREGVVFMDPIAHFKQVAKERSMIEAPKKH